MPVIVGSVRCCRMIGHEGDHYGKLHRSLFNRRRWLAKSWEDSPQSPDDQSAN